MLALDHVFCLVPPDGDWAARLTNAGWALDAGTAHEAQGTRNRRLVFARQYLELVWVEDTRTARRNPLRLDRRAEWAATGTSPFGIGLVGQLPEEQRADFWAYDAFAPMRVWVHHDNERAPERPLVFVLDFDGPAPGRPPDATRAGLGDLDAVRHSGPAPPSLPAFDGPPVHHTPGPHGLEIVVTAGTSMAVSEILAIRA
jgi:hypothetical protein